MSKESPDSTSNEGFTDDISEAVWPAMIASLRDFRVARNISLNELSKQIGVHATHLARVEKGHTLPNVIMALRWARALKVDFWQLREFALRSNDETIG